MNATTIVAENVNSALPRGLALLRDNGIKVSPRGMETLEYPAPVMTHFRFPDEMVLFDADRDANPFFHFFEALWVLAGRRDVAFLSRFNQRMIGYSDDGTTFHAPYGFRLRKHYGVDQIEQSIEMLREHPDSRQAVMSIWSPTFDLGRLSKDIPCNDMVMLKVRDGKLRMTVCIRSNDVIWGAYGANAVQFGTLLRYMAARIGVECGTLTQVSDSYHVYTSNPYWKLWLTKNSTGLPPPASNAYRTDNRVVASVVAEAYMSASDISDGSFDSDLSAFFEAFDVKGPESPAITDGRRYSTSSFNETVLPMLLTHTLWKRGEFDAAVRMTQNIRALDWRLAASQWVQRRAERAKKETA